MMKKIWKMRKDIHAVSPVIATILMVAITVVLAAVLYVMVLNLGGTGSITPAISTNKTTNSTAYIWTVVKITGDAQVQISDVYVQLKAAGSATFAIQTAQLGTTGVGDGTLGFTYSQAKAGTTIAVGDTFVLLKASYNTGSTLKLVTNGATGEYATLTV